MPSGRLAREKIVELVKGEDSDIYELGSGFGGLVVKLAKAFPERRVIGIENSPIPWFISFIILKMNGLKNAKIVFGDFLKIDFEVMKTIVCYQYPKGMQKIYQKIKGPTDLISYCFAINGVAPFRVYEIGKIIKSPIYHFTLLKSISGEKSPKTS